MSSIDVTFGALNPDKSRFVRALQNPNISVIDSTLIILNFDKSRLVRLSQE